MLTNHSAFTAWTESVSTELLQQRAQAIYRGIQQVRLTAAKHVLNEAFRLLAIAECQLVSRAAARPAGASPQEAIERLVDMRGGLHTGEARNLCQQQLNRLSIAMFESVFG